jgi:SpoVK/Ycf46/Vps4 family AAA+-type ATPase
MPRFVPVCVLVVGATEGYTGADIREVVLTGLKIAFHAGQELSTEHMLEAVPEIRPLSRTDPERVAAMTEWLDRHTKAATQREAGNMGNLCGLKRARRAAVRPAH